MSFSNNCNSNSSVVKTVSNTCGNINWLNFTQRALILCVTVGFREFATETRVTCADWKDRCGYLTLLRRYIVILILPYYLNNMYVYQVIFFCFASISFCLVAIVCFDSKQHTSNNKKQKNIFIVFLNEKLFWLLKSRLLNFGYKD